MTWPMTASPIADGEVANSLRWWQRLLKPINDQAAIFDTEDGYGWSTFTLSGGWVAYGGVFQPPQFARRRGIVYLRGLMKSGAIGTAATMPLGFLPGTPGSWSQSSNDVASARVDVLPSGLVQVAAYSTGGSNAYVSLWGISFLAEG